ncbi:YT66 protein, partial [Acromyrmex heyeri]
MTDLLNISRIQNICLLPEDLDKQEDPRTPTLRRVSYGIVLPTICCLGIIGNILNLVVLTRRNMRGTAYVYMRGVLVSVSLYAAKVEHQNSGGVKYQSVKHPGGRHPAYPKEGKKGESLYALHGSIAYRNGASAPTRM